MGDGSDGDGGGASSSVNAYFQTFQISFELNQQTSLSGALWDKLALSTGDARGRSTLDRLATLITGAPLPRVFEADRFVTRIDRYCTWAHRALRPLDEEHSQEIVFVMHPTDDSSLLVLRNTDNGLLVTPQGAWLSDAAEISKLEAAWIAERRQMRPVRMSPGVTLPRDYPFV